MKKWLLLIVCTASMLLGVNAHAFTLLNLYQVHVPIKDQTAKQTRLALQQGLSQVLRQVSANDQVTAQEQVRDALKSPEQYVQRYSYQNEPSPEDDGIDELNLVANFDRKAINELLKTAGQAIWGKDRPVTLVWLATTEADGEHALIGSDALSDQPQLIQQQAQDRGLPMVLPILDLVDQSKVTAADAWGPFPEVIKQASKRYAPDTILIGRMEQTETEWSGRWLLLLDNEQIRWQSTGAKQSEALEKGIDGLVDALSARYAVIEGTEQASELTLTVANVHNLSVLAKVMNYLRGLVPVNEVEVVALDSNRAVLELKLAGGRQAALKAIDLGDELKPVADYNDSTMGAGLQYQWAR